MGPSESEMVHIDGRCKCDMKWGMDGIKRMVICRVTDMEVIRQTHRVSKRKCIAV